MILYINYISSSFAQVRLGLPLNGYYSVKLDYLKDHLEKKSSRFDKNDPLCRSIAQIFALVTMSCFIHD